MQAGQTSCKTLRVCSATEYQSQAPTVSSNRVCRPCTLATSCAASTFLNGTCALTNNPLCVSCALVGGFQNEVGHLFARALHDDYGTRHIESQGLCGNLNTNRVMIV
jgi:hypothetical protein